MYKLSEIKGQCEMASDSQLLCMMLWNRQKQAQKSPG